MMRLCHFGLLHQHFLLLVLLEDLLVVVALIVLVVSFLVLLLEFFVMLHLLREGFVFGRDVGVGGLGLCLEQHGELLRKVKALIGTKPGIQLGGGIGVDLHLGLEERSGGGGGGGSGLALGRRGGGRAGGLLFTLLRIRVLTWVKAFSIFAGHGRMKQIRKEHQSRSKSASGRERHVSLTLGPPTY